MTIVEFKDENDTKKYQEWCNEHPQGFVLNINTLNPKVTSTKNVIHKANGCRSLEAPPIPNRDRPVTVQHPKLCSTDIRELQGKMESKHLPYVPCGICMK